AGTIIRHATFTFIKVQQQQGIPVARQASRRFEVIRVEHSCRAAHFLDTSSEGETDATRLRISAYHDRKVRRPKAVNHSSPLLENPVHEQPDLVAFGIVNSRQMYAFPGHEAVGRAGPLVTLVVMNKESAERCSLDVVDD